MRFVLTPVHLTLLLSVCLHLRALACVRVQTRLQAEVDAMRATDTGREIKVLKKVEREFIQVPSPPPLLPSLPPLLPSLLPLMPLLLRVAPCGAMREQLDCASLE